jgi:O-antigen/teichoic acid export membrane protein
MSLRKLGKNTVVYAVGNVGLRAASFLLIPLYTHTLSVADYGLLATLLITIQLMVIVMNMGMRTTLLRFIREYEENSQTNYLLGTTTFINIVVGIIVTSLSILLLKPFFRSILHTDHVQTYIFLTCVAAFVQSLNAHILSYYRAQGNALRFMMVGIFTAAILFIVTIILIRVFSLGIIGVLWASIGTYTIVTLFVYFDVLSKTGIGVSILLIPKLVRFGFPLIFAMSGQFIIGGGGIYFLSYFSGFEMVAIYSLGYKLASVLGMTTALPFQLAFQPYVFTNLKNPDIKKNISSSLTYLFFSIMFMSFCILVGSRILLPFIAPPEYSSAYIVIILLLPGVALTGINYFAETLLTAVKKTNILGLTIIVAAIISIILNYRLIAIMNLYGAVITFNASCLLSGLTLFIIALDKFPVPIEWKRIGLLSVLFFSYLIMFFLLQNTSNLVFYSTVLTSIFISFLIFYSGSFFNNQEKLILKNGVTKLKSTLFA